MPNEQRPLKIFLCHAHSDKTTVRDLYFRLIKDGVDAWLDKENLLPGQDWELEIRKAVREADVVVVCLSKQFNQAGFRQKEVRLALDTAMEQPDGEIFIIPARLEECDTLESLSKWQWVDLFEDDGYETLMRALRARANRIGAALQAKRNWLPNVTAPRKSGKSDSEKKPGASKPVPAIMDEKGSQAVKPKTEKLKSSKTSTQLKSNTAIVVAIIGLAGIIIAGLLSSPLIERILSPVPSPTEMVTATTTSTRQPVSSFKTQIPSLTTTKTRTPTPTPHAVAGDTFGEIALLGKIIPSENEEFTCADISPDGQIIATGSYNRMDGTSSVQLWRTSNTTLLETLLTQDRYITNVLFSPDGILLASGADNGTLRVWTVKSREEIASMNDADVYIQKIGFSKDGRKLAASTSSRIEVWDIDTGKVSRAINVGPVITSFVVGPDNKVAYTTSENYISDWYYPPDPIHKKPSKTLVPIRNTRYTMNYGTLDDLQHMQQVSVGFLEALDFSQDGEMLLGRGWNWGEFPILNLTNNETKFFSYSYGGSRGIFLPDSNGIIIASYNYLSLLHISDGNIQTVSHDHNDNDTSLAFSRNGWILISYNEKLLNIWGIPRWNSTPTPTLAPPTAIK